MFSNHLWTSVSRDGSILEFSKSIINFGFWVNMFPIWHKFDLSVCSNKRKTHCYVKQKLDHLNFEWNITCVLRDSCFFLPVSNLTCFQWGETADSEIQKQWSRSSWIPWNQVLSLFQEYSLDLLTPVKTYYFIFMLQNIVLVNEIQDCQHLVIKRSLNFV